MERPQGFRDCHHALWKEPFKEKPAIWTSHFSGHDAELGVSVFAKSVQTYKMLCHIRTGLLGFLLLPPI